MEVVSSLPAQDDTKKLTSDTDKKIFSMLVDFKKSYDKDWNPNTLKGTEREFKTLYNFVRSKADPTAKVEPSVKSKALRTMRSIQDVKDGKDGKDKGAKKDSDEETKKNDKGDSKDNNDNKGDTGAEEPKLQKPKQLTPREKEEAQERVDNRKEAVEDLDDKTKQVAKDSFVKAGIKLAGSTVDGTIEALAALLGVEDQVKNMVNDLANNAEKLSGALKTAREEKEKVKKEREKQIKDENDNYKNAKSKAQESLKRAEGDDKEKVKQSLEDIEQIHKDNMKAINDNAYKKIQKYDKILGIETPPQKDTEGDVDSNKSNDKGDEKDNDNDDK